MSVNSSPRAPAAAMDGLPDDVLVRCLSHLDQATRLKARLVCRRWAALCESPPLLRTLRLDFVLKRQTALRRMQSLLAHVQRHGQHLRSLQMYCFSPEPREVNAEAQAMLGSVLALCSGLHDLRFHFAGPGALLATAAWLPAMRHLWRVIITAPGSRLRLAGDLSRLSCCEHMEFQADPMELDEQLRLPPALTTLTIGGVAPKGAELPPQVAALPCLSRLDISASYSHASLAPLSRLAALTRLHLTGCVTAEQTRALTRLCHLQLQHEGDPLDSGTVLGILLPLRQLTALSLTGVGFRHALPALGGLSTLQRLHYFLDDERADHIASLALPPGAWCRSLRWLGTHFHIVYNSLHVLPHARQLEYLSLADAPAEELEDFEQFAGWAARHPPLQRLGMDFDRPINAWFFDELLDLVSKRPELHVFRTGSMRYPESFWTEMTMDDD